MSEEERRSGVGLSLKFLRFSPTVAGNHHLRCWPMISSNIVKAISSPVKVRGIPRLLFATRHWFLGTAPRLFDMGGFQMMLDPNDYFQCMMFYGRYGLDILTYFRNTFAPETLCSTLVRRLDSSPCTLAMP